MDYDKTSIPKTYAAGRHLSGQTMTLWLDAVAEHFSPPAGREPVFLDLGCGTGRFSVPLAERFGGRVIGVDPSEKMRAEAQRTAARPRVTYLAGRAEAIPCKDGCFDAALLSMVLHHFSDVPTAIRELARVLRPEGLVFLRTDLPECLDSVLFFRFFPAAKRLRTERFFPTADGLREAFAAASFECLHTGFLVQEIDSSLTAHYERLKLRSISVLAALSDTEFAAGLKALRQAAEAEDPPQPVLEQIGFLVFRKPTEIPR